MEQIKQFRTAGFGGFHRQDVLDYIERTAKEQTEKREELTRQLEEAKETVQTQAEELAALKAQLEEAQAARTALEAEKEALNSQLEPFLEEGQSLESLKQQLEDARQQAEGYLQLKTEFADIELDARQRASKQLAQAKSQAEELTAQAQAEHDQLVAQAREEAEALLSEAKSRAQTLVAQAQTQAEEILTQAQDQALHLREERRQLMSRTRRDFDTSSADLNASVTAALREVEQLRQTLLDLHTTFEENVHAVDALCDEEG